MPRPPARPLPPPFMVSLLALLLGGCALISPPATPTPEMPSVPVPEAWHQPDDDEGLSIQPRWWLGFEDPALERFVEQALRSNVRMSVALERLHRARLALRQASASRWPSASAGVDVSLDQPMRQGGGTATLDLSAGLSYEVDLWGRLAAARTAAEFEALATQEDRLATALALVGEVTAQHWELCLANEQLALLDAEVRDVEWMLTIVRVRHKAGAVPETDVTEIEQLLDSLHLQRLELRRNRGTARQALSLLLGAWPEPPAGEGLMVPREGLPPLPAGDPAAVVARRPDVRAAEARLRAQFLAVDEARARLYPGLELSASLSASSERWLKILSNPTLSLGSGLLLPLLEGERRALDLEAEYSRAEEAALQYRHTVMSALSEVENALAERPYLVERVARLTRGAALADRAERVAKARFEAGLSNAMPWLEQRRQKRDSVLALAKGRRDLLGAQMRLYLALGGDSGLADAVDRRPEDPLAGVPGAAPLRTVNPLPGVVVPAPQRPATTRPASGVRASEAGAAASRDPGADPARGPAAVATVPEAAAPAASAPVVLPPLPAPPVLPPLPQGGEGR
ncbi:TolC family protein [Ideonella livida]|uniref:TolC family protein n=1 Tax=Ideonella livida TaxID=2707176 RepID=A0A7C9TJC6_9BURK|nr:TolC family protein [Ideonella livida]NDY91921.1 TolC family protein [Ideonella livida]